VIIFKVICSTPHISPNSVQYACLQPCNHRSVYVHCKVHLVNGMQTTIVSWENLALQVWVIAFWLIIKFITICLYLLNHLITFECGVTYNQLFYVTQLWICLSHMLPLRSTSAFASSTYQWPCICIARWDSHWTQTLLGFQWRMTIGPNMHVFTISNFGPTIPLFHHHSK
jgi:hypothetical protein